MLTFLMKALLAAILDDDRRTVRQLLRKNPELAIISIEGSHLFKTRIFHWIYAGDSALHLAAAGYRMEVVRLLLDTGADPNVATNHRRSTPLHYAADGYITGPAWNAKEQVETIACLLEAGAKIDFQDKNGATPLHRAVRTRCAAAVKCLLKNGAKATMKNKSGSTPFHLAVQNTGRGGSGAEIAKAAQREIVKEFLSLKISPKLKDGRGKTVLDSARSNWIAGMLSA